MKFPLMFRSTHEKIVREFRREITVRDSALRIQAQALEEARKNDHRDPNTGRFVKKV
jgi:hypothetical protein